MWCPQQKVSWIGQGCLKLLSFLPITIEKIFLQLSKTALNIARVTDYWLIAPKQKTHLCYERFANVCRICPQTNVGKPLIPCRHAVGHANTPCLFWQIRLTETLAPPQLFIWKACFLHCNLNTTGFFFNLILHNNLALASIGGGQRLRQDHFGFCAKYNNCSRKMSGSIVSFSTYKLHKSTPPTWLHIFRDTSSSSTIASRQKCR